jgi:DNA-directed RNA polymerase subunit RPC12/RpoP
MPSLVDTPPPDHRPLVVCPACGVHTPHVWATAGYTCQRCWLTHLLPPMPKVTMALEPIWCPRCRIDKGSAAWAPQQGQRRCRVCGTSVMANLEERHA